MRLGCYSPQGHGGLPSLPPQLQWTSVQMHDEVQARLDRNGYWLGGRRLSIGRSPLFQKNPQGAALAAARLAQLGLTCWQQDQDSALQTRPRLCQCRPPVMCSAFRCVILGLHP